MMTRTELLEMIPNGENSEVEFKRDTLQSHELAKELVAFSNFQGGMVLLGVNEDGSIEGVTRDDLKEWVMSVCGDKIRPPIIPFFGKRPRHERTQRNRVRLFAEGAGA